MHVTVKRVHSANSDSAHDTSRWLTYCATENFLLIVAPSAFISSSLGMVGTAGRGITTARRHLGDTKTISIDLTWFSRRLFELAQSPTCCISSTHHDPRFDAWMTSIWLYRCHPRTLPLNCQVWVGEGLSLWRHKKLVPLLNPGWC